MNIASINPSQSFKGLNYENVSTVDRERFIRGNLKQLNEMGKNYDINVISLYTSDPNVSAVDIDVRPLKKGLNFFQRLFRPIGRSSFAVECAHLNEKLHVKEGFINAVHEAVKDLSKKIKLHK